MISVVGPVRSKCQAALARAVLALMGFILPLSAGGQEQPGEGLVLTLLTEIRFAEETVIGPITRDEILDLYDLTLSDEERVLPHWKDDQGVEYVVKTCREYENVPFAHMVAQTKWQWSFLAETCWVLELLLKAKAPSQSYLEDKPLALMDPALFEDTVISGERESSPSEHYVWVQTEFCTLVRAREVARADFNDDSIEDVVLIVWFFGGVVGGECPDIPGSLNIQYLMVFTRLGPDEGLVEIEVED